MSADLLVEARGLARRFGTYEVLSDLSFGLSSGQVLGFLGPNGAGKTTTMKLLTGNLAPTRGTVLICNIDLSKEPQRAKGQLGYLPEHPPLYRELSVDEYLRYCGLLRGLKRTTVSGAVSTVKKRCGLADCGKRLINNLSQGYRQRVGIAQAIIHEPRVVILDEPTVGLDPIQMREIRSLIRDLGEERGVILSSHLLSEVQSVCTHVQIINEGKLVLASAISELENDAATASHLVRFEHPPSTRQLSSINGVSRVERLASGQYRFISASGNNSVRHVVETACRERWGLLELIPERRSLEQLFVDITIGRDNRVNP